MFTVHYSTTGDDRDGVAMYDCANMVDVVTFFENLGNPLDFYKMSQLIAGGRLEVQDMKVWVTEDVFAGTLV